MFKKSISIIIISGLLFLLSGCPGPDESECTCISGCEEVVSLSAPFEQNGIGTYCWFFDNADFVNSWNMNTLEINGEDFTNEWVETSRLPAEVDGGYYIYYDAEYLWSHAEVE